MKERKCRTCAWWGSGNINPTQAPTDVWTVQETCHHECQGVAKEGEDWCRHWSETTGWDVFEGQPHPGIKDLQEQLRLTKGLLRLAAELFQKELDSMSIEASQRQLGPTEAHNLGVRQRWLEEYKTKC